jgi:hypothetical protein
VAGAGQDGTKVTVAATLGVPTGCNGSGAARSRWLPEHSDLRKRSRFSPRCFAAWRDGDPPSLIPANTAAFYVDSTPRIRRARHDRGRSATANDAVLSVRSMTYKLLEPHGVASKALNQSKTRWRAVLDIHG